MKNKINALSRKKRVYYFDHRHGVLKDKVTSRYHLLTGLMSSVLIFGGMGLAIPKIIDYRQNQTTANTLQRQAVKADTSKKQDASDKKLKDATTKAREDEQLAKQVKSKLKNVPGGQKWSVYIRDLKSNRMASINADNSMDAAGLSNLFITAPLEAKVPSSNWNYKYGKQSLGKCVETILASKDEECTKLVAQYSNLKNADSVLASFGFKKTTITEKEQKTTARETGDLLFRLQNSHVLSDKARRVVFDGLYRQKSREGIPAGCDQSCLVANITGEGKSVRHDAAIVTVGDAKYVVVVMTQGADFSQIADVASHIRLALQP